MDVCPVERWTFVLWNSRLLRPTMRGRGSCHMAPGTEKVPQCRGRPFSAGAWSAANGCRCVFFTVGLGFGLYFDLYFAFWFDLRFARPSGQGGGLCL
jgi:hypothetical protein